MNAFSIVHATLLLTAINAPHLARRRSGKEADQYLRITSAFDYPEDKLAKP